MPFSVRVRSCTDKTPALLINISICSGKELSSLAAARTECRDDRSSATVRIDMDGILACSSATTSSSFSFWPVLSVTDASYWRANLEAPVLFSQALEVLQSGRRFQLIEVGPHAALELPITQVLKHLGIVEAYLPYFSALSRGGNSAVSLLRLMGNLFITGVEVWFDEINSLENAKSIGVVVNDLPPCQWTCEQILWTECRASEEFRNRRYHRHELLGSMVVVGN